jgi:hypothetical protein
MILENIETRRVAEKEMKRPKRKIAYITDTPKGTGKRKRQDVDRDDGYDIDISDSSIMSTTMVCNKCMHPSQNRLLTPTSGLMARS